MMAMVVAPSGVIKLGHIHHDTFCGVSTRNGNTYYRYWMTKWSQLLNRCNQQEQLPSLKIDLPILALRLLVTGGYELICTNGRTNNTTCFLLAFYSYLSNPYYIYIYKKKLLILIWIGVLKLTLNPTRLCSTTLSQVNYVHSCPQRQLSQGL